MQSGTPHLTSGGFEAELVGGGLLVVQHAVEGGRGGVPNMAVLPGVGKAESARSSEANFKSV